MTVSGDADGSTLLTSAEVKELRHELAHGHGYAHPGLMKTGAPH